MNLLAFSDVHTDRRRARRLVERSRCADLVIGAGDFARFHLGLHRTIATLREIEAPVLLVPGNNESETALRRACRAWPGATVLHGEAVAIAGMEFFGLGGGVPETPLPLSFDLSEDDAAAKLAPCPSGAVMIVHSPPWGHVDEVAGRHLGSKAILSAIEVRQPPLVLCGHVHEAWGRESRIGATRVVNLGPEGTFFEL
jgi:Icc-related predicted phosphoesterase